MHPNRLPKALSLRPSVVVPLVRQIAELDQKKSERASRVTVCGFLIDVYCLGVKNVIGPQPQGVGSVDAYRHAFF